MKKKMQHMVDGVNTYSEKIGTAVIITPNEYSKKDFGTYDEEVNIYCNYSRKTRVEKSMTYVVDRQK